MKSIKNLISLGYLLMALLVIGIMYIWYKEWCDLEKLEVQNRHIDTFRQESHEIFVFLIELSLSGETVLEWEDADLEHYHYQRMAIDSMLCRFKTIYPTERIDSVRHLLEDKERQMRQIVQVFEQQQAINDKITRQVPIIVQKSVQEQPQKPKRKGFLGIFGKKEKPKPTVTTTMLRSLDRDMITEQQHKAAVCRNTPTALRYEMRNLTGNCTDLYTRWIKGASRSAKTGSRDNRHGGTVVYADR